MGKFDITPKFLAQLVTASPEGFFSINQLERVTAVRLPALQAIIEQAVEEGSIGKAGDFIYDPARLSAGEVRAFGQWYSGSLPPLNKHGKVAGPSIAARMLKRQRKIEQAKRRRRLGKRDKRDELRSRLVAEFLSWRHARRSGQHLWISEGPTNSGKTHRTDAVGMGLNLPADRIRLLAACATDAVNHLRSESERGKSYVYSLQRVC